MKRGINEISCIFTKVNNNNACIIFHIKDKCKEDLSAGS